MKWLPAPILLYFLRDGVPPDLFMGIAIVVVWSTCLMFISFSYQMYKDNEKLEEERTDLLKKLGRI